MCPDESEPKGSETSQSEAVGDRPFSRESRPKALTRTDPRPLPAGNRARVLLIEDDGLVAFSLTRLLKISGFEVEHVTQGIDALSEIRDKGFIPHLVISDYRLPGEKNGFQIIGEVREILGRTIPAILLTGDTVSVQPGDMEKHDVQLFYKPVRGDELLAMATRLIEGR